MIHTPGFLVPRSPFSGGSQVGWRGGHRPPAGIHAGCLGARSDNPFEVSLEVASPGWRLLQLPDVVSRQLYSRSGAERELEGDVAQVELEGPAYQLERAGGVG